VYEVVWLRLAMARFGVTTPMVSIVLSVFMAGLGIGSWAGGLFVRRFARRPAAVPLRLYGAAEILIGVSGVVAPRMIELGYTWLRSGGHEMAWGSSSYYLVSGAWISLSLLPWCACMGATFPFAMAAIRRLGTGGSERSFSYLYVANVLGAILGTLVPAFVLIELYGFHGTLEIARVLNVALGAGVIFLSFRVTEPKMAQAPATPAATVPQAMSGKTILWLLFATGLCSMALEVVWIREFTVYLGNVVYAFAAILALYLGATFLGSQLYRRSTKPSDGAWAWILLGVAALAPLLAADPRGLDLHGLAVRDSGFLPAAFLWGAARAALGVCPFSALLGYLTPMLVDRWSAGDPDRAGKAYAVNVLGSILGPLVAGFWILPWVGERWGLCLLALPLFAIGAAAAWRPGAPKPLFAAGLAVSLALVFGTKSFATLFPERLELRDYTATVIATGQDMQRRLLVNGTGMTTLTPITKVMAHLPLSLLDKPATSGLVICFGMGTTFRSMMSWGIHTTAVELVPSVPRVFGYFHEDGPELLRSPLARMVIDDGRRYLDRSQEQFDVIAVDPPPPVGAPTSSLLYSREFYAVLKPHLRVGGIAQIWFPGGDDVTQASVAKSLRDSFPYVRAYQSIGGWGIHFLARMQPFPAVVNGEMPQKLPPAAAEDLVEWTDATPREMLANVLSRERTLDSLIAPAPSIPPIDDDRPINEYFFLRRLGW
jgi:spermidine synthase